MTVDFRKLGEVKFDDIKLPPALPAGVYLGTIEKQTWDESRFENKNTGQKDGVMKYAVKLSGADESIAELVTDDMAVNGKTMFREYNIENAYDMVAWKEMVTALGISGTGKTIAELASEPVGHAVKVEITQRADKNDATRVFNDLRKIMAA